MRTTYRTSFACTLYNDLTRTTSQAKQLVLAVEIAQKPNTPFRNLRDVVEGAIEPCVDAHVIGVHNTDLIRLLEPKSGATVHDFLHTLKAKVTGRSMRLLGETVPHDTVNGDKVLVMGPDWSVTLEGLALMVLASVSGAERVTLGDGTYEVSVTPPDDAIPALI